MKSKQEQIRQHLLSGRSITGLEALQMFGVYRLSSVIHRLRERHQIATDMVNVDGVEYASYRMTDFELKKIKKDEIKKYLSHLNNLWWKNMSKENRTESDDQEINELNRDIKKLESKLDELRGN